jgi:DNA processing protein
MLTPTLTAERPVSPWLEMGAYEFLWTKAQQSFKTLADLFRGKDNALPSDHVLPEFAEKCARDATDILHDASIKTFGIRLYGTAEYPLRLRDARHPVQLLYFQGWWDLVNNPCIAVVGTRGPSAAGVARTKKLVRNLVKDGFTIVSGLASGIDAEAHKAAIRCGGFTIAVIGTKLSQAYPIENAELQAEIADQHLIISQVPIIRSSGQDWRSNRSFFPQRNVTMSALTVATLIVEASDTSGTLMQARAAIQQRRKLFILDSCFQDPKVSWPAQFEKLGAIRIRDYEDVRENLGDPPSKN